LGDLNSERVVAVEELAADVCVSGDNGEGEVLLAARSSSARTRRTRDPASSVRWAAVSASVHGPGVVLIAVATPAAITRELLTRDLALALGPLRGGQAGGGASGHSASS
jgi:hypothetical protein